MRTVPPQLLKLPEPMKPPLDFRPADYLMIEAGDATELDPETGWAAWDRATRELDRKLGETK